MSTPRIGVFGANGQVGLEVSVFLSDRHDASVIPVARTTYSSALLRRLGLHCRHGRLADEYTIKQLTAEMDVIADFGWPMDRVPDLDAIRRQVLSAVRHSPPGAPYVFISTQSVYRLDPRASRFSMYGLTKRFAERLAIREGKKVGRPIYILRIGEVHGPLQRVSREIINNFQDSVAYVPALKSNTVFTYTIAEALANIANNREPPGIYTVVSVPEWRWTELHSYYARYAQKPDLAVEEIIGTRGSSLIRRGGIRLREWLGSEIWRQKDALEYLGKRLAREKIVQMRLNHYRTSAKAELGGILDSKWRPYSQYVEVPGQRMISLTDTRQLIFTYNKKLLQRIKEAAPHPDYC